MRTIRAVIVAALGLRPRDRGADGRCTGYGAKTCERGIMIDSESYSDTDSAPLMAASIFLDALNVFQFFLRIFSRNN